MPTRVLTILVTVIAFFALSACQPTAELYGTADVERAREAEQAYLDHLATIPPEQLTPEQVAFLEAAAARKTAGETQNVATLMGTVLGVNVALATIGAILLIVDMGTGN